MEEISKCILKLSQFNLKLAIVIETAFTEPLETFHHASYKGNIQMYKQISKVVANVENARKETDQAKNEYYQYSSNAEKSQVKLEKIMEKMNQSNFSKKELVKETQKSTELKQYAEEAKYDYEGKVVIFTKFTFQFYSLGNQARLNKSWENFKTKFLPIYDQFDLKELNRVEFIKKKGTSLSNDIHNFFRTGLIMPVRGNSTNILVTMFQDLKTLFQSFTDVEPIPIKERIFNGNENLLKFKEPISVNVISYDKYLIQKKQNSLSESFHKIDLEDATKQELEDIKILQTIVFTEMTQRYTKRNISSIEPSIVNQKKINMNYVLTQKGRRN